MKEYIEREALEKDFNSRLNDLVAEYGQYDHYVRGFDEAVDRLEDATAADVVEVVRCKDCQHYYNSVCTNTGLAGTNIFMNPFDYCSYGAKMDKEG